jgi:hypothetical protein
MGSTTTPERPSAPPVIELILLATSSRMAVIASVSMRSVSALVRRITAPVAAPSSAAASAAAASWRKLSVTPSFADRIPAV